MLLKLIKGDIPMEFKSIFDSKNLHAYFNPFVQTETETETETEVEKKSLSQEVSACLIVAGASLLSVSIGDSSKRSMALMGASFTIGGISRKKGYLYTPAVLALLYFGYKELEKPVGNFYKKCFYLVNKYTPWNRNGLTPSLNKLKS
ncbi:MAG: hypothetical protein P0S93_03915 [Candidatus Neptunochlamydia sp.]|nr:hypothetical protein [Candidatus Neptunochlamydia sp.]